jgi:hypothetical protein
MPNTLQYGSHGDRVRTLQRRLNSKRFRTLQRKLTVDGQMGALTCAAVHNVKRYMGYDPDNLLPVAGQLFWDLLAGNKALTARMRTRRAALLAKDAAEAKKTPLRVKILAAAKADVGVIEKQPNIIKFNEWWNGQADHEPYCVRAGSYWAAKAGCPHVDRAKGRWQGTDVLLEDAKAGRNGVHLTSDPAPGNGFVIDFDGHSDPDHFGIYVEDVGDGSFKSDEANAKLADGRQGVGYHTRQYRNCWFIVFEN